MVFCTIKRASPEGRKILHKLNRPNEQLRRKGIAFGKYGKSVIELDMDLELNG